jgi:hypothetical protein
MLTGLAVSAAVYAALFRRSVFAPLMTTMGIGWPRPPAPI